MVGGRCASSLVHLPPAMDTQTGEGMPRLTMTTQPAGGTGWVVEKEALMPTRSVGHIADWLTILEAARPWVEGTLEGAAGDLTRMQLLSDAGEVLASITFVAKGEA